MLALLPFCPIIAAQQHAGLLCALLLQFVYLKEAFSPALEERISVLYAAFGVDGRLVVNYALTPAWG